MSAATSSVIFYALLVGVTLLLSGKRTLSQTFSHLGVEVKKVNLKKTLLDAGLLFVAVVVVLTLESMLLAAFEFDDSQKVEVVISSLSLASIVIAATLGPFAEELFFRGFLQKHAGVVIASVLFAVLHYSFGSVTEIIGALTAGLILGYWVKYRNSSLWPAIIAHAGYNVVSIALVLVVK